MKHWALDLIGKPWVAGKAGDDEFDCWGLVRYVQAKHYGRELPIIAPENYGIMQCARTFRDHPERARWVDTDEPTDGDIALLAHNRHPVHVGLWLDVDGGGLLHCVQGTGVIFQNMNSLKLAGWGRMNFLKFTGEANA
jgi:hypothetical protein